MLNASESMTKNANSDASDILVGDTQLIWDRGDEGFFATTNHPEVRHSEFSIGSTYIRGNNFHPLHLPVFSIGSIELHSFRYGRIEDLHVANHSRWRAKPASGSAMVRDPFKDSGNPCLHFVAVLPLANSPGGHRLGVNGLAVDTDRSILWVLGLGS